ncbi:hypothetical protein, partial [uncultured Bacteroides sp.]|uniref:hypothetical protein n=1 Tax=uncultured Bacteroides sp. TaxID=162156 RepID=UPI0025D73FB1
MKSLFRVCLNFVQHYFERSFRGCFSVFMRSIAGYVTNRKRGTDRKEAWEEVEEKLFEENSNRLLIFLQKECPKGGNSFQFPFLRLPP